MKEMFIEICKEENIQCHFLSKDWICVLEKDGVRKVIAGYKFALDDHALGTVIDDKYALYSLLNLGNISVVTHHIFYGENVKQSYAEGCNTFQDLEKLFFLYEEDVVLKVNDGTCGRSVFHIKDTSALERIYYQLTKKNYSISLCPYYAIENEYRVIVLNGKVELIYKKEMPKVVGDGKRSIQELLCDFNPTYFSPIVERLEDRILSLGEEYVYDWKFNLSCGSRLSLDILDSVRESVTALALEAVSYIGLSFGSVDVIKTSEGYFILEINSGVMMKHLSLSSEAMYLRAKEIYRKAILTYFAKKD